MPDRQAGHEILRLQPQHLVGRRRRQEIDGLASHRFDHVRRVAERQPVQADQARAHRVVEIEPILAGRDMPLTWYVGLDAAATRLGDALWNGEALDEAAQARVVGLYRLGFEDPGDVIERLAGEPVYLILAMTPDKLLRVKPQNLVTGLPVRQREMVN